MIRGERPEVCRFEWLGCCERNETYGLRFTQGARRWCVDISEETVEFCSETAAAPRELLSRVKTALAEAIDCGRGVEVR